MAKQAKQAKQAKGADRAKAIIAPVRIPWREREFRVLSNPNATPKMHETLESAIAHAKRHVLADREPIVQRLVSGKWVAVADWYVSDVPASLPMKW